MKPILAITLTAFLCTGCGDNKAAQAERDRQLLRELQRNENIQRQKDRDQQAAELGVRVLESLTR